MGGIVTWLFLSARVLLKKRNKCNETLVGLFVLYFCGYVFVFYVFSTCMALLCCYR